ncbi:MAG: PQQ-binding-like beta-propeller repeat protein [Planctomycetota bacterium]
MIRNLSLLATTAGALALVVGTAAAQPADAGNDGGQWLSWRGPQQNGCSLERGLPREIALDDTARTWTYPIAGRGTPVVSGDHLYTMAYEGEGKELQEVLLCLKAATGEKVWERRFSDFLTDTIYYRFSLGSPTIDPDTGNVYCLTTAGLFSCFTADGALRWQHSMMEAYGRLTFPNGRTGAPVIDGDLAIVHVISAGWGRFAPARDRFYAFDKRTGESVWSSTPGTAPKDSSFSYPVVQWSGGRRLMYAGLGGGNVACLDANTGAPVWRFALAVGGLSSSVVLHGDTVIATHGKENVDDSTIGRMVGIKRGARPDGADPVVLGKDHEAWRNPLVAFTSSPTLVGDRVYQTVLTGELACVDANDGRELWHQKLAPDQIHASPAWGDGILYVPMNNGSFHILHPTDEGAEVLQAVQLEGNCLGAPAIAGGRVFVHTTAKLYAFGGGTGEVGPTPLPAEAAPAEVAPAPGPLSQLQVVPADFVAQPGQRIPMRVRGLDASGRVVNPSLGGAEFAGLPDGVRHAGGALVLDASAAPGAHVVTAKIGDRSARVRLRILPTVPFADDFEGVKLREHPEGEGVPSARPPSWWVSAGRKWEILELDGSQVLARTLDMPLFQRTMSLLGHPEMSGYTAQVDIYSDGNRRIMSSGGLVNQRYLIVLKGNHQTLEVRSNDELLKEHVPYRWKAKRWYRLKSRVDVEDDGSGWVRAKVWPRDEAEPDAWTIEVDVPHAHQQGAPGLYGFTPQSRFRVYLDNLSVTKNV